jgi:hypothetical protein
MYDQRRISVFKWTAVVLNVVLLSRCIAHWKAFFDATGYQTYLALIFTITLFIVLLMALAIAVYAEEKVKDNIRSPKPLLEHWADRFFLIHSDTTRS